MEADIDVIVPVDPGEAQVMIELIELLFDEWYGARERRNSKLSRIAEIRLEKDELRRVGREKGTTEAKTADAASVAPTPKSLEERLSNPASSVSKPKAD